MGERGPQKGAENAGRPEIPTTHYKEAMEAVCNMIATTSHSLNKVLQSNPDFPDRTTFYKLINKDETFAELYARAKEDQADFMADEMLEIADKATAKNAHAVRLQLDTRKWLASKLKAKRYGDKIQHDHEGNVNVTISKDDSEL